MANFPGHPNFNFEIPTFPYTIITDPENVAVELERIGNQPMLAFDFETTGLDYIADVPVGISIADESHSWYFHGEAVLEQITPWLQDQMEILQIPFAGHNVKFDMHCLSKLGVTLHNPVDTQVAQWLVDENYSLKLKDLARTRLGHQEKLASFGDLLMYTKRLVGKKRKDEVEIHEIPMDILGPYAALDARLTFDLWQIVHPEVQAEGQEEHFFNVQMPFTHVLLNMEQNGILIDHGAAQELSDRYTGRANELWEEWEKRTEDIMGKPVNPRSTKQLRELLFDELGLKSKVKTPGGELSTNALVLTRLQRQDKTGLVKILLEHRKYDKMIGTYLGAMLNKTHSGRIHTSFNHTGTVTGRLSSSGDLNLQNIPSRGDYGKDMRALFIAPEDYDLVGIDYSQIELRILTHFCRDESLVKAYLFGVDVHQMTADRMGVPRYVGKTVNFGTIYGQGPPTLADTVEKTGNPRPTNAQAKRWLAEYDRIYPGVPKWKRFEIAAARKSGYITTIAGRRRHVEGMEHFDDWLRSRAERQAINSKIQGSAGDAINQAMLWVYHDVAPQYDARMLLQVHDELLFEVPKEVSKPFAKEVQIRMEAVKDYFNISVPIIAEPSIGPNWTEAKD